MALTSSAYWRALLRQALRQVKRWFETWQLWVGIGATVLALIAVYALPVNELTTLLKDLFSTLVTPRSVTLALAVGALAAILEGGRRLYMDHATDSASAVAERDNLRDKVRAHESATQRLNDDVVQARTEARETKEELENLRSYKATLRALVEFEIAGTKLRDRLDPLLTDREAEVEFSKWVKDVEAFLREHNPQSFTFFSNPVQVISFLPDGPERSKTIAGKLLERLRSVIEQAQGLERKTVGPGAPPIQITSRPLPPGTPTMQ